MTTERELVLRGLAPAVPGWAEFEAAYLATGPDCPLVADLLELVQGRAGPEEAQMREHIASCPRCASWVNGYQAGQTAGQERPDSSPARGSLLAVMNSPQSGTLPASIPSSLPLKVQTAGTEITNVLALVLAGQVEEAIKRLQTFLSDILEEVGLDPGLTDAFRQFLARRLGEAPRSGLLFPDCLRAFAREHLHLDDLPACPPAGAWEGIVVRSAFRLVESSLEQPGPVGGLLRDALAQRVQSVDALAVIRERNPAYSRAISDAALVDLRRRIHLERKSIAGLFGVN